MGRESKNESVKNKLEIMKNKGQWQLTDELIERINKCEPAAMAKFYFDNFKKIKSKAWSFRIRHCGAINTRKHEPSRHSIDDLIQQVYVDLPYMNFDNAISIGKSMYYCFHRTEIGGLSKTTNDLRLGLLILDKKIGSNDSDKTIVDFIKSPIGSAEAEYINSLEEYVPNITIQDEIIDKWLKTYLSDIEYRVMREMIFTDYTDYDISDICGLSHWNVVDRIRKRAVSILARNYLYYIECLKTVNTYYYEKYKCETPKAMEKIKSSMSSFSFR